MKYSSAGLFSRITSLLMWYYCVGYVGYCPILLSSYLECGCLVRIRADLELLPNAGLQLSYPVMAKHGGIYVPVECKE